MEFLILPETLVSIEDEAFAHCYNLRSVVIPPNVKKIGYSIFGNCENLRKIYCQYYFLSYKLCMGNSAEFIPYAEIENHKKY